jgi:hypothetical protein
MYISGMIGFGFTRGGLKAFGKKGCGERNRSNTKQKISVVDKKDSITLVAVFRDSRPFIFS